MFGLLDWIKIGAGAALGVLVASGPAYLYGAHNGRQQAAVAALEAVSQAYKDRTDENEAVEALNPGALCVELGGMPDDCAAELRRLAEDHSPTGNGGLPGGQ